MSISVNDFREVLIGEIPSPLLSKIKSSVVDDYTGDIYVKYANQWYKLYRSGQWVKSDDPTHGHIEVYSKDQVVYQGQVEESKNYI